MQQIVAEYAAAAELPEHVHPHLLRYQMLTWLTAQGLPGAQIQLINGHGSKKSLEVYQRLSLAQVEAGSRHLITAFRYCFYNSLARGVFSEHPELSELSGLTQEEIRKQFSKADTETIRLFRERAASIIDTRPVAFGNQSGPVGSWSECALIIHEISKQKRHIPIRQLVRRSARALQGLKPCFMMGPLSVAQYLAPGQLKFDLLVMDEASQLKPEDAIGAIARSGQIVIVGDSMQLPPTSFFQRVALDAGDENDEDRAVVEEGESILDVVRALYQPMRRLRWHYRSQHHSLIAFSNQEFYQNDLIVFPSSHDDVPGLGVKYRAVAGGVCENSRNPREASAVVDAVLDHMKECPNETLGVVALNFEQRELIEELLDQRLRADPFAVAYQEQMNAGPERFFIKNLEKYPRIHSDRRVTFRVQAPSAKQVAVAGRAADSGMNGNIPYEMRRGEGGGWQVTTGPVRPGFHYYELIIDGIHTIDPSSETYFGWAQSTSGLEVPDEALDFYSDKDVPHGEVRIHWYHSKTTGRSRRAYVYTPPGYDSARPVRYPVLYLQHGAGENETSWTWQGKANLILDNLIAEGKTRPMIVVMDSGYAVKAGTRAGPKDRGNEGFEELGIQDLVPVIDSSYRTLADRRNRAIAGLSMGGGQALRVGLGNPDKFSAIGSFSGATGELDLKTSFGGVLADAVTVNKRIELLWIGCGAEDRLHSSAKFLHEALTSAGIKHVWMEGSGSHEWQVWRKHLYDFAPRLFQPKR